jgi:hypothetical protein
MIIIDKHLQKICPEFGLQSLDCRLRIVDVRCGKAWSMEESIGHGVKR